MLSPDITNKLDELMRSDLLNWRTFWFTWLERFTILVVSGLVCEGPELALELVHIVRRRWQKNRFGFNLPAPDVPDWVKIVAFVGWGFIVTGVAGELYTQSYVSDADTNIQAFNTGALTAAQKRTAAATEVAGLANLEAARANKHAAQLEKEAEAERLRRVTLEASVGWRRLTETQKQEIGIDLRMMFSTPQLVGIWYVRDNTEASQFASDIAEGLRAAKFVVWPPREIGILVRSGGQLNDPITRDPTGVSVTPSADPRSGRLADAIVKELTSFGFDANREPSHSPDDSRFVSVPEVSILVEARPEGPQGKFKLKARREEAKEY